MMTRKEQLEELLDNFQTIKRNLASPGIAGATAKVTGSQWMVLRLLAHKDGHTVKEVAQALGVSSSAATQLINSLVQSGHILREVSETDRRSVKLTLSKQTKHHLSQMRQQSLARLLKTFTALTDDELSKYLELNKKIAAALSNKNK